MKTLLCAAIAVLLTAVYSNAGSSRVEVNSRSNVLIILTDDQFHSTPVCVTTRAPLLKGRNHNETGGWDVHLVIKVYL